MWIKQALCCTCSVLPGANTASTEVCSPWCLVQVGDQLDRGDNEIQILYFLERLQREAEEAGGKLHVLNGNHETMNVAGRFTYATLPALASFYEWQAMHSWGSNLKVHLPKYLPYSLTGLLEIAKLSKYWHAGFLNPHRKGCLSYLHVVCSMALLSMGHFTSD